MDSLIHQYKLSQAKIKELETEQESNEQSKETQINHLKYDVYAKIIRNIEEERDNAIKAVQEDFNSKHALITSTINEQRTITTKVEHILDLMAIPSNHPITEPECYYYTDRDEQGNYSTW